MVNVNLKHKPDWFLQRHPFGLVPILERNEVVVGESAVCNDYLDQVYPQNPLYPSDSVTTAQHRMLMSMFEKVPVKYTCTFNESCIYEECTLFLTICS